MKLLIPTLMLAAVVCPATATAQTDLGPLNLPTMFAPMPFTEDFETGAGTIPPYMALTNLDAGSLTTDPEAWCNVGQLAACQVPYEGSYCLEMGLLPGSTNYHDVRNAMVLGFDGSTGFDKSMSFMANHHGEETDTVDGVWVSDDGSNWYQVWGPWGSVSSNTWSATGLVHLDGTPANTSGLFYVAFVQEDNFPYNDLDGAAVDNIKIPGDPLPPDLILESMTAGLYTTMRVDSDYPGHAVKFLASLNGPGPTTIYGLTFELSQPMIELAEVGADNNGTALFSTIVHPGMSGVQVWFQAVVLDFGVAYLSNGATQIIN